MPVWKEDVYKRQVVEYISDTHLLGAKTLFATHYHELTELEGKIENVNNYCIAVKEKGDDIVFLRKIVKGGADKSYGIQVAKLAGVPDIVIERAKEIVEELSDEDITTRVSEIAVKEHESKKKSKVKKYDEVDIAQMSLFDTVKDGDVLEELKNIDVGNLTPIDALNTIYLSLIHICRVYRAKCVVYTRIQSRMYLSRRSMTTMRRW